MATGQGKKKTKLSRLFNLLAAVDKTYRRMPLNLRLEIEKISQGLAEYGPRKLRRRGTGTEFYESRDFRKGVDEYRQINPRLSAKEGKPIVVEKEAEIRQHFYLWRDSSASMHFASAGTRFTKKESSEIMLIALAKHLAKNEELIGILDLKGTYRGGKAGDILADHMMDVSIITGNMPVMGRKLPRNSTVVLFSDFMDLKELETGLKQINGSGLKGYMIMVLDKQELDFNYRGHVEFEGMEGEGRERFKKAETMQDAYKKRMTQHINEVEKLCKAKGFTLIVQRTDKPLHNALMALYGLTPKARVGTPAPGP